MRRNRGQSIIQILISATLLSIGVALVLQVSTVLDRSAQDSSSSMQLVALLEQINQMISTETVCRWAIGGSDTPVPAEIPPDVYLPSGYEQTLTVPTLPVSSGITGQAGTPVAIPPQPIILYVPSPSPRVKFLDASDSSHNTFQNWTLTAPGPGAGLYLQPLAGVTLASDTYGRATLPVQLVIQLVRNTAHTQGAPGRMLQSLQFSIQYNSAFKIVSCAGPTYGNTIHQTMLCPEYDGTFSKFNLFSNGTRVFCAGSVCRVGTAYTDPSTGIVSCH